jgi:Tol biopolymer transport system component
MLTPDGAMRVTVGRNVAPGSGSDLIIVEEGGRNAIRPLVVDRFEAQFPALSPDGRWLAYVSDQSSARQVYVRPFGRDGETVQVSQDGGTEPVWSRDGRELFYRSTSHVSPHLVAASVRDGASFDVVARRALFDVGDIVGSDVHANYDVSPDGSTFAMVRRSTATRIMIIQNLPALVQRLRGLVGATP